RATARRTSAAATGSRLPAISDNRAFRSARENPRSRRRSNRRSPGRRFRKRPRLCTREDQNHISYAIFHTPYFICHMPYAIWPDLNTFEQRHRQMRERFGHRQFIAVFIAIRTLSRVDGLAGKNVAVTAREFIARQDRRVAPGFAPDRRPGR